MGWRSKNAWCSRARWRLTAFAALLILGAGRSGAEMPDRTMSLHIAPATPGQNPCAPELIGDLTCADFVVNGDNTGPQWLYIISTGVAWALNGVVLSLWYEGQLDGWVPCTDGIEEYQYPAWPTAGSMLLIEWHPPEPYAGPDHIVVLGACHVPPGLTGFASVIPPIGYAHVLISDGGPPFIDELGVVDLASSAGGGYNPCDTVATPTVRETWGKVKALYR